MSKKSNLISLSDEIFSRLVTNCFSKVEFCQKLDLPYKGEITNIIKTRMNELSLSFKKRSKYHLITKICPVCKSPFETFQGSKDERTTCSYSCSNTHFRSGSNNGMHQKSPNYRTKCFGYRSKQCFICSESRVVEVHHLDGNHSNNSKQNLIPLCPTHHQLAHTKKYSKAIADQITTMLCIN